ncbi:protein lap1 isoform X2 [Monomorium pharaonis]|uniref:protein lap1 isoform X2 n=1 Tax=Monomorium pharaonis TaxID=307658 RepID=UPI001747771F|nr:protein lap1 isoform X2 [Monomorium pharaonis]
MNDNTKKHHASFENPTSKRCRTLKRTQEIEEEKCKNETFYHLSSYNPLCNNFNNITKWLNLTNVNLSNNKIDKLPKEFGILSILQLNLSQNRLSDHEWLWLNQSPIKKTLLFLDISNNSLLELSEHIWDLNSLVELNVSDNLLEYLSQDIGNVKSLKILDVSHNLLSYLPARLLDVKLEIINMTMNPFDFDEIYKIEIPRLIQFASKMLLQHYSPTRFPSIAVEEYARRNMIETCSHCKDLCTTSYVHAAILLSSDLLAHNVINDLSDLLDNELLFEFFHCYPECKVNLY